MRLAQFLIFAALVGGVFSVPVPALADPPTGSLIDRSDRGLTKRYDPRQAKSVRPALNAYFRCTASLNRSRALEVLQHPFRSDQQLQAVGEVQRRYSYGDVRTQDCFSDFGSMKMAYDPVTAVSGYSEFFIQNQFDESVVAKIAKLTAEDWQSPGLTPRNGSEMIGLCVAQAGGNLVYDLVVSEPESVNETAAIRSIVPLLGPCLTDGVEVSFDKTSLRALLAYGLYRALSQMTEREGDQS